MCTCMIKALMEVAYSRWEDQIPSQSDILHLLLLLYCCCMCIYGGILYLLYCFILFSCVACAFSCSVLGQIHVRCRPVGAWVGKRSEERDGGGGGTLTPSYVIILPPPTHIHNHTCQSSVYSFPQIWATYTYMCMNGKIYVALVQFRLLSTCM